MIDETTDRAAVHPTKPSNETGQVIAYSCSAKSPKAGNRLTGYRAKLAAALIFGVTFSLPAAAKLYKWVDDNGTTHYGEVIPPEYANKDRVELNKAGQVVKTDEVLTPEKRRAKEQADAKKREDDKAALEQRRHDTTLINTYNSAQEIDLARGRSLQQIDARINVISSSIKAASNNLAGLQKEADGYTKRNREIPGSLQDDLRDAQARLDKLNKDLMQPQAEKAAIEARYDADKARYIALTGKK